MHSYIIILFTFSYESPGNYCRTDLDAHGTKYKCLRVLMKGTPAVLSIHFRSWSKGLKEDHKTHHGPKPNSHLFRSAALGHRYTAEFQLECYPQPYLSKGK